MCIEGKEKNIQRVEDDSVLYYSRELEFKKWQWFAWMIYCSKTESGAHGEIRYR